FLRDNAAGITAFKNRQQAAFEAERHRWAESGQLNFSAEAEAAAVASDEAAPLPAGQMAVGAPVPGNVWKINVAAGDRVEAGASLVVLESMKMEIPAQATVAGTVVEVRCAEGRPVQAGDPLVEIGRASCRERV